MFDKGTNYRSVAIVLALTVTAGCKGDGDSAGGFCPPASAGITWQRYGTFQLAAAGRDATARQLIGDCGWQIHQNHNGGVGDTLQVESEGRVFVWAFNRFAGFVVSSGWTGTTDRGVGIGSTRADVLAAHPRFQRITDTTYRIDDGDDRVTATFDSDGSLIEFYVGSYLRRR